MAELQPLAKTVQELAASNIKEVPERYIRKDSTLETSFPVLEIPTIDLQLLASSSTSREELEKLRSALSFCGCIQAINHGLTSSFLDKVQEVGQQFFALPSEEKKKYSREVGSIEGYGNDMILSEHQILDWTDRLYLILSPEEKRNLKFWPENPQHFREILHEYSMKLQVVLEVLLKAMARSLNLEENCFLNQYGDQATMQARFNYYPVCPKPEQVLGVKPHADGSAITMLLQDKEVEGLQVLKDDQWFRVPIIPQALLINVGDQVEIMSNGIFKSPVHRVLTNSERERITLAVFCIPHPDQEIGPVEELIDEKRPRLYKKVKDYVSLYFQYYQKGRRPIEAALI
ncbi:Oxoglutarate/iron-dependent dioxygenase [Corchorus olitorius]|uniref:Oxoglutarate/iron-dependent dioxygenase n=1 Tax=Corchorus olitorius TaxID=93759 RepID=A0A1R3GUA0_9ROSI|nr:Oxoglutarate/iron-dependent dioxygenase [Corchorus olitorius]